MGMDVYGNKPSEKAGEYFRNSCWWWRPLWEYCEQVAPALTSKVKYAQSNDGDGLGALDSVKLADALDIEIASGRTAEREQEHTARIEALPDRDCWLCHGTGLRPGGREQFGEAWVRACNGCNGCQGTGRVRPQESHYPFSAENVESFAKFLRCSGGFEIR